MLVTATSPDRNIRASIGGADNIMVTFVRAAFSRYDEPELRHQLERLGALAWVAFDRARTLDYQRTLRLSSDEVATAEQFPRDERHQRYDAELAALEVGGTAPSGMLHIHVRGLLHWRVDIERGAPRQLREQRFTAELNAAIRTLFADRVARISIIKSKHFDLGLPSRWRGLLDGLDI